MERNKNIFDKIGSLIPGYRGYAERDGRRNSDKVLRDRIADHISECVSILNTRLKNEAKNNNLDSLQELEECRQELSTLADKIRYASYGESSFFSDSQIKEEELQNIYQLDYDLFLLLKESEKRFIETSVSDMHEYIGSVESMLKKRNDFIKGCK